MPIQLSELSKLLAERKARLAQGLPAGSLSKVELLVQNAAGLGDAVVLLHKAHMTEEALAGDISVLDEDARRLLEGLVDAINDQMANLPGDDPAPPVGTWVRPLGAALSDDHAGWFFKPATINVYTPQPAEQE